MKLIITLLLAFTVLAVSAQDKKPVKLIQDTSKLIYYHQNEVINIYNNLLRASQKIHKLDIKALDRDTLDNYLGIGPAILRRMQTTLDTTKKDAKKP